MAKTIHLEKFDIIINLVNGGGSVLHSSLKEICQYCHEVECEMDCPEFGEYCTDRDPDCSNTKADERKGFLFYNGGVDAIESMILSHAVAGIDIESESYQDGIQAALDSLGNNS